MSPTVLVERNGHLAHLILNRPEVLNAIDNTLGEELGAACDELAADDSVWAIMVAVGSSCSRATTWFTRPNCLASDAVMRRAVKISSLARLRPIKRGKFWVPPPPGMMPRLTSVSPKTASSEATMKSANMASSVPPPRAKPCTAAIIG